MQVKLKLSKALMIDLAVLVVAIAVGCAWRGAIDTSNKNPLNRFGYAYLDSDCSGAHVFDETTTNPIVLGLARGWDVLQRWVPYLASLTIAISIIGLRTRKRRRDAWKSAGICGCIVASTFLLAEIPRACLYSLQLLIGLRPEDAREFRKQFVWSENLVPRPDQPGVRTGMALAVTATWVILAIGRRWRIGPTWQDRVGFAIGLGWVCIGFVLAISPWDFVRQP